jgi:hypothetical protein
VDDYKKMLQDQNNVCAICKRPDPSGRRLCIDHDHETEEVRGLLCCICNIAISLVEMDADWNTKAKEYLSAPRRFVPHEKTKRGSPEWKEKCRRSNIEAWKNPELLERSKHYGKIGRAKQLEGK